MFGFDAGGPEAAEDIDGLNEAGAIVMGALADVPAIDMATEGDDLIGMIGTADLADDVPGRFFGQLFAGGFDEEFKIGISF